MSKETLGAKLCLFISEERMLEIFLLLLLGGLALVVSVLIAIYLFKE